MRHDLKELSPVVLFLGFGLEFDLGFALFALFPIMYEDCGKNLNPVIGLIVEHSIAVLVDVADSHGSHLDQEHVNISACWIYERKSWFPYS